MKRNILLVVAILLLVFVPSFSNARGSRHSYSSRSVGHSYNSIGSKHVNSDSVMVRGYRKKNGTYVHSYHRTSPNSTKLDNYSTKGNVNPYTGKPGTINP